MRVSGLGRAAAAVAAASLVLASFAEAQNRDRFERGGAPKGSPRDDASRDTASRPDRVLERDVVWFRGGGVSIGASIRDTSASEIAAAGLSQAGGAFVLDVTEGGPASKAGIGSGDLIVELDGERVRSARHLGRLVRETAEGRTIEVTVARGKERRTVEVTPASGGEAFYTPEMRRRTAEALDEAMARLDRHFDRGGFRRGVPQAERRRLGVELLPLSDQLAAYFGVKAGVLVARVLAGSPAELAGLRAGDVMLSVNAAPVHSAEDVADALAGSDSASVTLSVMRERKPLSLTATLPARGVRLSGRVRPV
jgi:S1-C subfamily serine protease